MTSAASEVRTAAERPRWRAVAIPSEHGGWGLTLEPVLLGLLVAPSWAGLALGAAAFLAFLARTPLKLVGVDLRRRRWLPRTRLALRIGVAELAVLVLLAGLAVAATGATILIPVAVAAPLVAVELWFDVRSRSRRLVPELCGAIGICGAAAAIVLAGEAESGRLAAALWIVLAAQAVGAIPFVRLQISRLRRAADRTAPSDLAQLLSVAVGTAAVATDTRTAAGLAGLVVLAGLQAWWSRRPVVPAKVLGLRQMVLGLALVVVTALGARLG